MESITEELYSFLHSEDMGKEGVFIQPQGINNEWKGNWRMRNYLLGRSGRLMTWKAGEGTNMDWAERYIDDSKIWVWSHICGGK